MDVEATCAFLQEQAANFDALQHVSSDGGHFANTAFISAAQCAEIAPPGALTSRQLLVIASSIGQLCELPPLLSIYGLQRLQLEFEHWVGEGCPLGSISVGGELPATAPPAGGVGEDWVPIPRAGAPIRQWQGHVIPLRFLCGVPESDEVPLAFLAEARQAVRKGIGSTPNEVLTAGASEWVDEPLQQEVLALLCLMCVQLCTLQGAALRTVAAECDSATQAACVAAVLTGHGWLAEAVLQPWMGGMSHTVDEVVSQELDSLFAPLHVSSGAWGLVHDAVTASAYPSPEEGGGASAPARRAPAAQQGAAPRAHPAITHDHADPLGVSAAMGRAAPRASLSGQGTCASDGASAIFQGHMWWIADSLQSNQGEGKV